MNVEDVCKEIYTINNKLRTIQRQIFSDNFDFSDLDLNKLDNLVMLMESTNNETKNIYNYIKSKYK